MISGRQKHYRTWREWLKEWTTSESLEFLFRTAFFVFTIPMFIGFWIVAMAFIIRVGWLLVFGLE